MASAIGNVFEMPRYVKIALDGSSSDALGGGDEDELCNGDGWQGRAAGVALPGSFGWSREQCMDRRAVAQRA